MGIQTLYEIIRDIVDHLAKAKPGFTRLPTELDPEASPADLGMDMVTFPVILEELKLRLDGRDVGLSNLSPSAFNSLSLKQLLRQVQEKIRAPANHNIVVYVDDEEENLFVFKRRFGKDLNLKTFSDSLEALDFIRMESRVALVITDEVMPKLGGNALCSEVRKVKPFLKFILITGNPNNDQDLMYNSLRNNRFYDFLNKPLDLEGKSSEYLTMIKSMIVGGT
ncbi:MAG: response regulator [Fibrobacteria bacterium]